VNAPSLTYVPDPRPLVWVCSSCVLEKTTPPPDPVLYQRTDGFCSLHMELVRLDVARWKVARQREKRTEAVS
jgi:hypothetical protein